MKRTLIAFVTALCCLLIFAFACSENGISENEITYITDIEGFSDMQKPTYNIVVEFNNGTLEGFSFSITEKNEIEEVMEILFSSPLSDKIDPDFSANTHFATITIYQGNKTYSLGTRYVDEINERYYFTTSKLTDKIVELATAHGAFNSKYTLTVEDPTGYIIEPLRAAYRAGERVIVKTTILYDVDLIAYLDGVSLGIENAVKTGDTYTHWEFYFTMPDHDAVLSFELTVAVAG